MDTKAGDGDDDNPELQKLLTDLGDLDGTFAKKTDTKPADVARYNLDRTDLIEKIVARRQDGRGTGPVGRASNRTA